MRRAATTSPTLKVFDGPEAAVLSIHNDERSGISRDTANLFTPEHCR